MPIRNVIVAYDGSSPARRALQFAADLAEAFHSSMTVVHVIQIPVTPPEAALAGWADLLAAEERAGQTLVDEALNSLNMRGLDATSRIVVGAPADRLAELAASAGVDLVVAGSTGKGAIARILLGSVTTRLLHISTKPVLVVP